MTSLRCSALLLLLAGCLHTPPAPPASPPDAGPSEAELIAPKVDALEQEVAQVVGAIDEALWQHWTTGAPLDLAAATAGHDALFSRASLATLQRARALRPQDERRIGNLERWLGGELLARGVAPEALTVANLEASLTFTVDGKEHAWRELNRLLVSEKSAVKRRALWNGSHAAALKLDAALARRDEKARALLAELGLPGPLAFAAQTRGLTLEALRALAEEELSATEQDWRVTLEALSEADVRLPSSALTRAELPRLLKVSAVVDAEFPKAKIAPRAVHTLGTLGVYGRPGLTLDLSEAAKKNPLPLTVAPRPGDVRVSVKPFGGLRDQQAVLGELGAALVLARAPTGHFALDRLGRAAEALEGSELFAALVLEDAWLNEQQVGHLAEVKAAAKAERLYLRRRAAGVVLASLATEGLEDEAAARAAYLAITSRALALQLAPEEGARWRLDTGDFLRSATQLLAMKAAGQWREKLGDLWWTRPWNGDAPSPRVQGEGAPTTPSE